MAYRLVIVLGALLLVAGCSGMTTYIDYDQSADFESYKTFAWAPTKETSVDDSSPPIHQRIVEAIESKLQAGGLKLVNSNPDLYVTYHTDEKQEMQLNTSHWGYGYGGGWYWDPYWHWGPSMSTTTTYEYTRGTLIIDIWDAATKNLVWRGTVEKVVEEDFEKTSKDIYKAIDRLAAEWERKYKRGR
jgi:hypothetical protein